MAIAVSSLTRTSSPLVLDLAALLGTCDARWRAKILLPLRARGKPFRFGGGHDASGEGDGGRHAGPTRAGADVQVSYRRTRTGFFRQWTRWTVGVGMWGPLGLSALFANCPLWYKFYVS